MTSNRVPRRKPSSKRTSPAREDGHGNAVSRFFDHFAAHVTKWAGSPVAFGAALIAVVAWGLSGPAFGYSETWQLVINTGTTIVTFLMVFVIQQSQNKDSEAVHLKLDELLIALRGADERLVMPNASMKTNCWRWPRPVPRAPEPSGASAPAAGGGHDRHPAHRP